MPLKHTPPPEGAPDAGGRAEMSRCNNTERQWLGNASNKIQLLGMQAEGLKLNPDATREQVDTLAGKLEDAKALLDSEWAVMTEVMRTAGRLEALAQATTKWNNINVHMVGAAKILAEEAAKRTGTKPKSAETTPIRPRVATSPTATTGSTPIGSASQGSDLGKQVRRELDLMRAEFDRREAKLVEKHSRAIDEIKFVFEERERLRQEAEERREKEKDKQIQLLQLELQQANKNNRGRSEKPRRYESAKDRLHRPPSPRRALDLGGGDDDLERVGLGQLGDLGLHIGKSQQKNRGGDDDLEGVGLGRLGDLGLHIGKGQQKSDTNRPVKAESAVSSILGRFGACAGQVSMPVTDPYQTTLQDESDDYYRDNFPEPFNEPPPADANRISEFRKLEGLVPKFSGKEEEFLGWMSLYIPIIHRANCPVAWKAAILNKGMSTDNPTVRSIVATSGATKEEYAQTIHKLVRAFAHPQGVVAAKLRDLENIVIVREEDHEIAEQWLILLEAYLNAAKARGMQAEIFGVQLYEDNLARMEEKLAREYLTWSSLKDLPNNAVTICAWLEEKVRHAKQLKRRKGVVDTRAHITDRFRTRTRSSPPGKRTPRGARRYTPRGASYDEKTEADNRKGRRSCPLDGEHHDLANCDNFKALSPKERRERLREWKRCYACFHLGHNISACTKNIRCAECPRYHHTLLHGSGSSRGVRRPNKQRAYVTTETMDGDESDSAWSESSEPEVYTESAYKATSPTKRGVVLQTVPIDVYNKGKKIQLNCLIDQGATGAFMSKRAAEALEVTGYAARSRITGFDGAVTEGQVLVANIQVAALGTRKRHWIQVQVTKDPAGSYTPYDWTKHQNQFTHIKNLPLQPPIPGRDVDIMLGLDTPELVRSLVPDIGGGDGQPLARFTRLGWVVGGPINQASKEARANFAFKSTAYVPPEWKGDEHWQSHSFKVWSPPDARDCQETNKKREEDISQILLRMWEVDTAIGKTAVSAQDEKIFGFLRQELVVSQGKYLLPTIWKLGHPNIGNNFKYALARLQSCLRSKQLQDKAVQEEYGTQIKDWRENGYVEEVITDTPDKDRAFYLPHFAVVRWDKATTKVRIVMDAAAKPSKTGTQLCLNDCLLKGPKLVNDLPTVLLRYRKKRISLAADIKKMFFQIKLRQQDRDYHRFLWQENGQIKVYRWAVHPFGSAASPCVAIFTVKDHARRLRAKYPRAAETVIKSTLVDDNLDSCDTEEEAIQLGKELVGLFKEAGMQLGKVVSNSKRVMDSFPEDMRAESLDISSFCTEDLDTPVVKSLGIVYLSDEDAFSFETHDPGETTWTKRKVLRHKAKLYDPHGLVAPHVAAASIILQKLWRAKKDWDQQIQGPELQAWQAWLAASRQLPQLRVPRCIGHISNDEDMIHSFCDASADAYAAVAYYVTKEDVRLVCCKHRVAPLKALSIPRLELLAAELLLDVVRQLRQVFDLPTESWWYWSDSTNVLSWLRAESRSLNEFVGNRVAKITESTDINHWRWVDTANNPADIPSRGMLADKLIKNALWWTGPKFLKGPKACWPTKPLCLSMPEEAMQEVKKAMAFTSHSAQVGLRDQYQQQLDPFAHVQINSWKRTIRAIARCKKLLRRRDPGGTITRQEIEGAETQMVKHMQQSALSKSHHAVVHQQQLPQGSPLQKLDPFLDADGLLRMGGRLKLANFLPFEQRHQKIVPKDHPWTAALIRQTHADLAHQGPAHVLNELRQKFWLLSGRQTIKTVLTRCVHCRRQRAREMPQKMGPTIEDRFPESRCRPFTFVALDMAGPYYIKDKDDERSRKAYFILFTCCTIRAVHLEPVYDISASSFLAALERFTARRGKPQQVRSDNGTNFVAGLNELKRLWDHQAKDQIAEQRPDITWVFNPPKAPYFGGLHERMIGAVKRALYHMARPNLTTGSEAFATMLTVAEGIINTRPITYTHNEPSDPEPLTPAHFLGIGPYRSLAQAPGAAWDKRTLWRTMQQQLDTFWKRFCNEMKGSLQPAQKWLRERRNLQEGDVVVVLEARDRGKWPLGRIIRTEPSRDGLVRKVQVMFKGNTVRRPVNTLIPLNPEPAVAGQQQQ